MKLNRDKLKLAMARACMCSGEVAEAAGIPRATFNKAIGGNGIRPATLGKIARALGCDPADIMEYEE